jgi:hypothetical protein
MAGTLPPLFIISDDDHGGYAAVAVYTLLCLMICVSIARIFTRWYIVRFTRSDDYFLVAATVSFPRRPSGAKSNPRALSRQETNRLCQFQFLAILQSVFIQKAFNHGLGKKQDTVSDANFILFQKVHSYPSYPTSTRS